ncbi:beta-galactosidase [Paenibacillus sp. 19GGS1-52]|uniref:beta-galactosidase n=1 Tax=Paenibacillus sp. 19GGS1-52 TaxID=2758563 RepID=UPI001EFB4449|nr:beta-galactosidase [Paenibacillus sp. 19GGS1-52]ULO06842.1 beta-galactosidase [Paenibacillus sp. 19GGS1-52]
MEYSIHAGSSPKDIYPASLRLGGSNPQGDHFSFTNYYMELNGQPYFAMCGEFHYSRYPEADWETEIKKMKMSGINIMATYIFWNHHEEIEAEFNWQGNRNLRRFVELCARNGLYVILRVGPFCHGEVRNGGLPDWLFGRSFDVRSNDAGYLHYVRRLYEEIGKQATGQMFKDGGPVIGIQLENEFNAAAALWELTAKQGDEYLSGGSGGSEHMRLLKQYAEDAGMIAPFYTSTGWGDAPFLEDEVLPLYGGYAYTPWSITEQSLQQQPTQEYLFVSYHDDVACTGDFAPPYPRTKYPFACCEMGGGMQTWYLSRFQVEPESVAAMSLMKIGGGCNFIGYYMFHGGTNPVGALAYLNESTTPRITYDFQAPIGEFGQIRASNGLLRPLHYFLRQFGARLAPLATVLPESAVNITPENTETLRYAVRTDGKSGFVFINNYQDHVEMDTHEDVRFVIELTDEIIKFPQKQSMTISKNASILFPFNFTMGSLNLRYATAQPVTVMESASQITYFFRMPEGIDGEFLLAAQGIAAIETDTGELDREEDGGYCVSIPHDRSALIRIKQTAGMEVRLYVMTFREAATLWELETDGATRILFSEAPLVGTSTGVELFSAGLNDFSFREYTDGMESVPAWTAASTACSVEHSQDGMFSSYHVHVPKQELELKQGRIHDHKITLDFDRNILEDMEEVILKIDYTGNVGYAFAGGQLFHDHFYNGQPWEIGLSRFREVLQQGEIVLETTPLRKGVMSVVADAGMAMEQHFEGEQIAMFHSITAETVYRVALTSVISR